MFVLSILLIIIGVGGLGLGLLMMLRKPAPRRVPVKDRFGYRTDEWEEVPGESNKVAGRWTAL